MLTQITIDGRKHMAVVFDKSVDAIQISAMRISLSEVLRCAILATMESDETAHNYDYSNVAALIQEMSLNLDQAATINAYFGAKSTVNRKAQPVTRECIITY